MSQNNHTPPESILIQARNSELIPKHPEYLQEFSNDYIKARDLFLGIGNQIMADYVQQIINALIVSIKTDGSIQPFMSGQNEDGNYWESPDTSKFDDSFLKVIKSELKEQKSTLLKARYNDLAYILSNDHECGKNAVNNYLELAKTYEERDLDAKKRSAGDGLSVSRFLSRAYTLSVQIEYERESVKEILLQTLASFNNKSRSKNKLCADLVSILIIHEGSLLKEEAIHFLINICEERASVLLKDGNSSFAKAFWDMQSSLEEFINADREEFYWENKKADLYFSDFKREKTSLAKIIQLENALKIYVATGNEQKASLVQELIQAEAPNVELQQSTFEIDMRPIVELAKQTAKDLAKDFSGLDLLIYLSNLEDIIPDNIETDEENDSIIDLIASVHILDEQNHLTGETLSDQQKKQKKKFDNYGLTLNQMAFYYTHLLRELLINDQIKEEDVIEFINRSWVKSNSRNKFFGSTYFEAMDWSKLLMPSLKLFLVLFKEENHGEEQRGTLMLSTDSLVTKIEGLIREIFQIHGASIFDLTQTKEGKTKKNRRTLHTFLMSEQTKKIRKKIIKSKKERFFINFLLLDLMPPFELSLNLRNRISHTRHTPNNYSLEKLILLFMVTLRIMRVELPEKQSKKA